MDAGWAFQSNAFSLLLVFSFSYLSWLQASLFVNIREDMGASIIWTKQETSLSPSFEFHPCNI